MNASHLCKVSSGRFHSQMTAGVLNWVQSPPDAVISFQVCEVKQTKCRKTGRTSVTHADMTLQLKIKAQLFDLHCSVGLTDWDMDKELKLATTTDQFYHGEFLPPWFD